jgi:outer membrane biosynthesis protein TonB
MVSGDHGSIVDRISLDVKDQTAGGAAQSVAAVPYYRDDSCFDDGTGDNPGADIGKRTDEEPRVRADGTPRKCWRETDGVPAEGTDEFFQGSIATHGLHLLFLAESDNARQTVPVTEIVSDWQMVMLPGRQEAAAGERYGRAFEKPMLATVGPQPGPAADDSPENPKPVEPKPEEPKPDKPKQDKPKQDEGKKDEPKQDHAPKAEPASAALASSPATPARAAAPSTAKPKKAGRAKVKRSSRATRRARAVRSARRRCARETRRARTRAAKRKAQRRCAAAMRRARRAR